MFRKLALALAVSLPALAQVTETVEVVITSVDVVITDGKGNRVRGLTKDDFEVLENGQAREITNFSEYSTPPASTVVAPASAPAGSASEVSAPPLRRLLVVIDNNTLSMSQRRPSIAALQSFLDTNLRPGDQVMIATLSQSFVPKSGWTTDRAEIHRVLATVGAEGAMAPREVDRLRANQDIDRRIEMATRATSVAEKYSFEDLMTIARNFAERTLSDVRHSASLLTAVVGGFSQYREKKVMIVIGEGLDAHPGLDIFQKLETLKMQVENGQVAAAMRGSTRTVMPMNEYGRYNAGTSFQQFAAVAYRKGIPIYAINPGTNEDATTPVEKTIPPDNTADFSKIVSKMVGYHIVASTSGGVAFMGQRPEKALGQIANDLGSYYSIGFRPTAPPTRPGTIRVRTKAGHHVRTVMTGIPEATPEQRIGEAVVAHHILPPPTNDLQVALATQPGPAAGEKKQIKLLVLIPVKLLALARQGTEVSGGFDVYVSIGDGTGKSSGVNKQTHAIRWPADALPQLMEKKLTYAVDLTLEPGSTLISVGVVDHRSKKTGFERVGV